MAVANGGESSPHPQGPFRNFARGACHQEPRCCLAQDWKVCKYSEVSAPAEIHAAISPSLPPAPQSPGLLEWDRHHSEPLVTLPGSVLGLRHRGSGAHLPSLCGCALGGPGPAGARSLAWDRVGDGVGEVVEPVRMRSWVAVPGTPCCHHQLIEIAATSRTLSLS